MKNFKLVVILTLLIAVIVIGSLYITKQNESKDKTQNTNIKNTTNNNLNDVTTSEGLNSNSISNNNIAIVYFSATGNTKQIAEYIQSKLGCDIFEIIPKQKYTEDDLNYGDNSTRATMEQNDDNARPEIGNTIDVSNYETIFLGYPIWWGDVPKIMLSFIDNSNLDGKTIIPFCTSGSTEITGSENTLKQYNKGINWQKGKRFSSNSSKEDVNLWVDSLNINLIGDNYSMETFIIEVNNRELVVKVENNSSSKALLERLKEGSLTINASDYNNFEKVGELGFSLPRNDEEITTKPGDVILYQGNNICLYYNTNSWNFTKLGEITNVDSDELKNILGDGNITMTLKLNK